MFQLVNFTYHLQTLVVGLQSVEMSVLGQDQTFLKILQMNNIGMLQ